MNRAQRRRQQKNGGALTPEATQQLFSKADSHLSMGQLDAAERCYRQLHDANPGNADVLNTLGILAGHQRNFPNACRLIRKAIRINPNQPKVRARLDAVLDKQSDG